MLTHIHWDARIKRWHVQGKIGMKYIIGLLPKNISLEVNWHAWYTLMKLSIFVIKSVHSNAINCYYNWVNSSFLKTDCTQYRLSNLTFSLWGMSIICVSYRQHVYCQPSFGIYNSLELWSDEWETTLTRWWHGKQMFELCWLHRV